MTIRKRGLGGMLSRWPGGAVGGFTILGAVITVAAPGVDGSGGPETSSRFPAETDGRRAEEGSIEIPIDLRGIEQLQHAFENGHQPWRGEPISVAHVAIMSNLEPKIPYENLKVERETKDEAVVAGEGKLYRYRVYLKRLVTPKRGSYGIWAAVRIEYDPVAGR